MLPATVGRDTPAVRTGETGGFIRIDGRDAGPVNKAPEQIRNDINGELQVPNPDPKGVVRKGTEYVQWVEVFYNNNPAK